MKKAVFFDLDGTLLPMDIKSFAKGYLTMLAGKLSPLGLEPETIINSVWAGVKDMYKNDGSATNKEIFWLAFEKFTGKSREGFLEASDAFYENEFRAAQQFTSENPLAKIAVELAGNGGRKVVLATNPVFPKSAQLTRLSWIDLSADDFELITDYESDSFTKPNPQYYLSICERIGVSPDECIMIGNDVGEDMMGASQAGLSCFLVTDYIIESDKFEWGGPSGNFGELLEYLKAL
ncbi:MAG: HAD family hydrolase [Clostridia bacterium]|nr:HAD family hydrolase [Clostridia bacterium]